MAATNPIGTIRAVMTAASGVQPVAWRDVVAAIGQLANGKPSADAEQALVALLSYSGTLNLGNWGHLPHSQSPHDMIWTAAIDALWRLSGTKYAALCQQVAAGAASPIVKRLVAARFPLAGSTPASSS